MQALDAKNTCTLMRSPEAWTRERLAVLCKGIPLLKIGYKPRIELMNPLIRGLSGVKMSSSIESSKIDLLNNEETVKSKLNKADCVAGDPENGVMALLQYTIFVIKEDRKETFVVGNTLRLFRNLVV